MSFHVPNQWRMRTGTFGSDDSSGNCGAFFVPNRAACRHGAAPLRIIASDGEGWEHVSVSLPERCPTWAEMCLVKNMFWDDADCVVQFHPPSSEYINNHSYCLHLWRPTGHDIPTPPSRLVDIRGIGSLV